MERQLVTRRVLARELSLNAATRPLNIGVTLAVAVAAVLLQTMWLLPIAFVVYVAMALSTFFDPSEAERVSRRTYERARPVLPPAPDLSRFEPSIAQTLELARAVEEQIREASEATPVPGYDVTEEVARLMTGLDKLARQCQQIHIYLAHQDEQRLRTRLDRLRAARTGDRAVDDANAEVAAAVEDQLAAMTQLKRQLMRLEAQMEHVVASLGAIHAQVVRMGSAEEAAAQPNIAAEVRSLRREVNIAAEAMRETYDDLTGGRSHPG